ncbi:MFS transporter [Granulicella sp. WH15]|nr:MFS transporter [Granulicella sp. WH15]
MYATFILTGLGTFLLGPILPMLSRQWHLADAQAGLLLMAQFCGSFCGGISTSGRLRRSVAVGVAASTLGLAIFALAPGLAVACTGLVIGGFGVGRTLTAIHIIAGRRFTANRGVSVTRLNLSWSFGAMLSPLLAAWLTPHFALRNLLLTLAGFFLISIIALVFQMRGAEPEPPARAEADTIPGLRPHVFLYFLGILFVYGGLETCLSGWLTTFALRYGTSSLALSEYTLVLLLLGLTVGRAIASALLHRVAETTLIRVALGLSAILSAALATAHTAASIAAFAVLLGLSLAAVFPVSFSILLGYHPRARQAGAVIAVSGLGAASLPWLMGVLSTRTGSLQLALGIPVAAALVLLVMILFPPKLDAFTP